MSADDPSRPAPEASHRGGLSMPEYEARVWDMAKHQLHPTCIYVAAQVAGASRLLDHALYQEPGAWMREGCLFLASFAGAWACFYSTLLRVAGFKSLTITFLVPAAVVAALAIWFVFPAPDEMSPTQIRLASALLVAPGALIWPLTMRRWSVAKRDAAAMLASKDES